ncbi:DUF4304 domain-containing protein [Pseudochryseolinea flava]|uniref:DUF4304 domain-containing protein n=1 Tax=Pseudochryseolinea flava TaxID=2059302 RepID=A0A364Y356_9BACT|nr:DUF4304 domain-containing protein [Pseudochryseolinea flava]RAW00576.1 hypothetical protein DQQ10_13335 [Pseudochryseolinea flava]
MTKDDFKTQFNQSAKMVGFERAFGGWFKESPECIVVLDLQKSNFADRFELNIKIYVQRMFAMHYSINKDLVKKDVGDLFRRQPATYDDIFSFEKSIDRTSRVEKLNEFFKEFVAPFTNEALSIAGIRKLAAIREIALLAAVEKELDTL